MVNCSVGGGCVVGECWALRPDSVWKALGPTHARHRSDVPRPPLAPFCFFWPSPEETRDQAALGPGGWVVPGPLEALDRSCGEELMAEEAGGDQLTAFVHACLSKKNVQMDPKL
ncbi:hypothetical protein NDU88_003962 [Pleurodeles waltl]|uniref:Uncharacterized protein n=1 Tax=Pleurodeles waltl TaxID=8319 RepID=A0AAV7UEC0_PLEWA|nr:hypothetical protein NDU88_003962 [Pleurodeles waltl]